MGLKSLAESIILQSIEDLYNEKHREDSIKFFVGEGFLHCADIAGLKPAERSRILEMVKDLCETKKSSPRLDSKLAVGG